MGNSPSNNAEVERLKELSKKAQESCISLGNEEAVKLVENLESSHHRVQEWAANTISWLTQANEENRRVLADAGCLKLLVQHLKTRDSKVLCWSLCALGNMCIENKDNKKQVIELKGLENIVRLLKSSDVTAQRWACNAVGVICMDNDDAAQVVSKAGGVSALVNCLHSSNLRVKRWATFALGNVLNTVENRHLVVKKDGLDPLISILDSPKFDSELKRWSSNIIGLLCTDDPLARVEAGKIGAVEPLVVLLRDSRDPFVVRNAASALSQLCLDNEPNKAKVKMLGGVQILLNTIQTVNKTETKLQLAAGMALLNICDGDAALPKEISKVLSKAKGTVHPEHEIRKLVDLVDNSKTVAMRLKKEAPKITDLFETLGDLPLSPRRSPAKPSPSGNPLAKDRIMRTRATTLAELQGVDSAGLSRSPLSKDCIVHAPRAKALAELPEFEGAEPPKSPLSKLNSLKRERSNSVATTPSPKILESGNLGSFTSTTDEALPVGRSKLAKDEDAQRQGSTKSPLISVRARDKRGRSHSAESESASVTKRNIPSIRLDLASGNNQDDKDEKKKENARKLRYLESIRLTEKRGRSRSIGSQLEKPNLLESCSSGPATLEEKSKEEKEEKEEKETSSNSQLEVMPKRNRLRTLIGVNHQPMPGQLNLLLGNKFLQPVKPLDEDTQALTEDEESPHEATYWEQMNADVEYKNLIILEEMEKGREGAARTYQARYKDTTLVFVREITVPETEDAQRRTVDKVESLKLLEHPNIPRLVGICVRTTNAYLVSEWVDGSSLRSLVTQGEVFSWRLRINIATDIAKAISYAHGKGVVHGDVNSGNVLVKPDRTALLANFRLESDNFSREAPELKTWLAPEVLAGQPADHKSDVFSFGMLLVALITREDPPMDASCSHLETFRAELQASIGRSHITTTATAVKLINLATTCVISNPDERPTIETTLRKLQTMQIN